MVIKCKGLWDAQQVGTLEKARQLADTATMCRVLASMHCTSLYVGARLKCREIQAAQQNWVKLSTMG